MIDLHQLPTLEDRLSYLYLEHGWIDQSDKAVAFHTKESETHIPVASLALLMLGPGTSITHAAVRQLADNNCLVAWCGEEGVRFYAYGAGGTRKARGLLAQAWLVSDPDRRLMVVRRMYEKRFGKLLEPALSLEQIRGMEGRRVRAAYDEASRQWKVVWRGRSYKRDSWATADPVNRALSAANSCLYGLCHAAIVSAGYSPALGFIHTGKQLSFVYDIADLYKVKYTIPAAFAVAAEAPGELERRVRRRLRDSFRVNRLMERIIPDIQELLAVPKEAVGEGDSVADGDVELAVHAEDPDLDSAAPGELWDPAGPVAGGTAYGSPTGNSDTPPETEEEVA
jgi:CRISPR-associated protein Cas1